MDPETQVKLLLFLEDCRQTMRAQTILCSLALVTAARANPPTEAAVRESMATALSMLQEAQSAANAPHGANVFAFAKTVIESKEDLDLEAISRTILPGDPSKVQ
jgi:hypothetical protein